MKRTLPPLLLLIMLASSSLSAVSHKVFQTATSSTPIRIAILADHYTDEDKFDNDVRNFITYGLLAHPYYAAHADDLQIETFFEAVSTGEVSKYGFNVEIPSLNCALSWEIGTTQDTNTWQKISAVVKGMNPRHTIVLGDHPYSFGCTDGEWTYIGEDAAGTDMLAHELGHGLGQLHDEWVLAPNVGRDHPGLSADPEVARNCHHYNNGATAPWTYPGAAMHPGCDLYDLKVFHAYDHMVAYGSHQYCLMGGTNNAGFCPVCRHYMDQEFEYLDNPDRENPEPHDNVHSRPTPQRPTNVRIIPAAFMLQPKPVPGPAPVPPPIPELRPGATGPIVRLIVTVDPDKGLIAARKAFPITAQYTPNQRRLGEYAYEVLHGNQVLGVAVIPSNLFRSHDYQGGSGHNTSGRHAVDVTLQMPGVTAAMLKETSRDFKIRLWSLAGVTDRVITSTLLTNLIGEKRVQPRGELTAEQIRLAM